MFGLTKKFTTTVATKVTGAALVAVVSTAAVTATPAAAWEKRSDAKLINKMIHALSPSHGGRSYKRSHGWKKKHYGHRRHYKHFDHYGYRGGVKHYGWSPKYAPVRSYRAGHVDLEVFFHSGSARLTHRAYRVLDSLGDALSYGRLRHSYFLIGGHTDAAGSRYTNRVLSQSRAHAVKRYLVKYFGIAPRRLVSVGFGEDRLAFPQHPFAKRNRRVEVSVISKRQAYRIRHRGYRQQASTDW